MLKTWQVSNFKSIREMSEPLHFAPLTIFCGTNSSGKSSLLQSILLFKQTLEKKGNHGPRMTLNGEMVKLGSFDEIVTDGLSEDNDKKITCTFELYNPHNRSLSHYNGLYQGMNTGFLKDLYKNGKIDNLPAHILENEKLEFPEIYRPPVGCSICFGSPMDKNNDLRYPRITSIRIMEIIHEWHKDIKNLSRKYLDEFFGWRIAVFYEESELCIVDFHAETEDKLTVNDKTFECFFPILDFDVDKVIEGDEKSFVNTIFAKSLYEYSKNSIIDFFSKKLYYVGPLRADPKENNDTTSQNTGVGPRGEYTADYFTPYDNLESFPLFFGHDTTTTTTDDYDRIITERIRDLIDKKPMKEGAFDFSVYEWLKYGGVADEAGIDSRGELFVKQGNIKRASLKNVGVGVSQVLPIIVQCIVAEPDSTIIIEQPELHLHPKMQSRLADFFLVMSLLGKQIIIETHSEYIIDKLRLRIAQAPSDAPINDKVAVFFSEKRGDYSEFRRIHINEYSVMSEWPEGFFDESMQTAREIMLAAEEKKLKNSGANDEEDDGDY